MRRASSLPSRDAGRSSSVAAVTPAHLPDFRASVQLIDMFTPRTIHRYTWHDNGAVYGAPDKRLDGRTKFDHLYICGTDQGYVGIVGSILSGILVTNRHLLGDDTGI